MVAPVAFCPETSDSEGESRRHPLGRLQALGELDAVEGVVVGHSVEFGLNRSGAAVGPERPVVDAKEQAHRPARAERRPGGLAPVAEASHHEGGADDR